MENVLIVNTETKTENRRKLRNAISKSNIESTHGKNYPSEARHTKVAPFEGSIYSDTDTRISSKNIQKMYDTYTPSIWWILSQSIVSPFFKLLR